MEDITDKFTSHLKNVLTNALVSATEQRSIEVRPLHFLHAITTQKGCLAAEVLRKSQVNMERLENVRVGEETTETTPTLSADAKRCIEKAVYIAHSYKHRYVGTEHLLAGIMEIKDIGVRQLLERENIKEQTINDHLKNVLQSTARFPEIEEILGQEPSLSTPPGINSPVTKPTEAQTNQDESTTPALNYFTRDLTETTHAEALDPVIGREEEIQRIMEILCRRTKNNPILLGEPGVGKTAVVEGLAKNITAGTVPPALADKRVLALDLASVIAGTVYRGEFENRIKQIIEEAREHPEVILFIDEIHTIMGAGAASGSLDAANMLKPALARGEIRCIGATTPAEYKKHMESDAALDRRFQAIRLHEPEAHEAIQILQGLRSRYESFHNVQITTEAIEAAVHMSTRYMHDRFLPDKAIDLIDEAAASIRVRAPESKEHRYVRELERKLVRSRKEKREAIKEEDFDHASILKQEELILQKELEAVRHELGDAPLHGVIGLKEIAMVVSRATQIPADQLAKEERDRLKNLPHLLKQEIIGQDHVVEQAAKLIQRARTGIQHPERPLASFLFVGPSGVGKTELARSIARHALQDEKALIRIDMSEFSEGFTVSKLIGSPAGYVGYRDGTQLTDRIKERPHAVVLFDEMEKAHRDAQNLLLQILETGVLKDATGKEVSFRNAIIVMTSNIGLERYYGASLGFAVETPAPGHVSIQSDLEDAFRPELINRIDQILPFKTLTQADLTQIAKRQLKQLEERLKDQGSKVKIYAAVAKWVAKQAKDPKVGAREIRRIIQNEIEGSLAETLLSHTTTTSHTIRVHKDAIAVETT